LKATELQQLASAMRSIKKRFPAGGKRYNRIVENPYEAGYLPLVKPTGKDRAAVRRVLRKRAAAKAGGC
jgi:hypothetical protein